MTPPAIDLVIFDCDGVLVDSEPLAMRVLLAAIEAQGIVVPPGDAFRDYLGRSLSSISETLRDSHGMPLGDAALESMRHDLYALYRKELKPTPGVAEVLERLPMRVCVASSSSLERIRLSLDVTGLLPRFEPHIFSASMVARGKPAPDLFLHAAHEMGVSPDRCLVIEDSPAGVRAAQAAGMRVVAYLGGGHIAPAGLRPAIEALAPDAIIDDMRQLPALVVGAAFVVGVDVGTGSARAGVFTTGGDLLARAEHPIDLRRIDATRAEHNSEQIWDAVCASVREAVRDAAIDPEAVQGIAFDATCSLVIRDRNEAPLAVSAGAEAQWDTLSWFDHRAIAEAEECTATGHRVLDYAGGVMSPEMEVPKLMWLKRHRPEAWTRMGMAFDLADFLGWKATGSLTRSRSTLVCKWNYLGHEPSGWPDDFLAAIGLDDLRERCALPNAPAPVGGALGPLTSPAAAALGLATQCVVGVGLVDAHAGTLGALGGLAAEPRVDRQLVLVAGTSNSILALAPDAHPMHGIWGPYHEALLPGLWLSEGGQSAAGALLDHLIRWHAAGGTPDAQMHARIAARITELDANEGPHLAPHLHVVPDFHGNRSPLAQPRALGTIHGLSLDDSFDGLCRLYWRAAVGLALGLRQIIERLADHGLGRETLHVAGGHTRSPLLMQLYADATGRTVIESATDDAMLLGAAMVAASAAGAYPALSAAAAGMGRSGRNWRPNAARWNDYDRDYTVMLSLQQAVPSRG